MTLQLPEVLFPDAELWATGRLRALLATRSETYLSGIVVSNAVPATRPARLVTIRRDGGSPVGVFDRPRFGINVYAAIETDATKIAQMVTALLRLAPGDGVCTSLVIQSGASPIPDAVPRRYIVAEATLRGGVL